jgi:hypothetical protein
MVKQHLAAIRTLFDWLVTGQVVATNPAHAVRGPKHFVKTCKTTALTGEQARELLHFHRLDDAGRPARPHADRGDEPSPSRASARSPPRASRTITPTASAGGSDRPVYVADSPPASTAQTESASGNGSPWRCARCAGRRHGLAALQRAITACVVPIASATPSRVLSASPRALMTAEATVNSCSSASRAATIPGPSATPAGALGGDVFPALLPPSPISGPWRFRSSNAFRNTVARIMFVRKMDFCFSVIGTHARFKILSNGNDAPR